MRQLILLRHAHAESAASGQDDLDRPLSPTGLAEARAARIRAHGPEIAEKVRRVFVREHADRVPPDPDAALYDGFIGNGDKGRLAMVRATPPAQLTEHSGRMS